MLTFIINFIDHLQLLNIAGYLAFFFILEHIFPAEKNQKIKNYFLNLQICFIYIIASSYWSVLNSLAVTKTSHMIKLGLINMKFSSLPGISLQISKVIIEIIIIDFFYYWFHRLQHTVPALWQQHKIHHLDENLNSSSANRHHWLEELFRIPFLAIPLSILFKFDPIPTGIIGILTSSWGYFIHSNLKLNLSIFTRFIGGPQVHRIHHSILPEHYNKNFAAFFPIWDCIFRTYHQPKTGEYPPTGLLNEKLNNAVESIFLPFHSWWQVIKFYIFITLFKQAKNKK